MIDIFKTVKRNPSNTLAAISCIGVVGTGVVSFAAGWNAHREWIESFYDDPKKCIRKHVIAPIAVGGLTIASIITGNRIDAKTKMELAAGCAAIVQGAKNDVKKKIEDQKNPPFDISENQNEEAVFFEEFSGRKFVSTLEEVHRAEQEVVNRFISESFVTLNDFYMFLDLETTLAGEMLGWVNDGMLDPSFADLGEPEFMNEEVYDETTGEHYYNIRLAWNPYCLDHIGIPLD